MNLRSLVVLALFLALPVAAADVVTVGTVDTTAATVDVPVYVRDTSGTPLGMDREPAARIQSLSIKVTYAPAGAVSNVTFSRAGITAGLSPTFESAPKSPGTASLLATFQQSTNPIPFTLDAGEPGDEVAHLVFTLSASATPGTTITLTLDPALTQLTDEGGTQKETTGNGTLALADGAIHVVQPTYTLSLSPGTRSVNVGSTAALTVSTNTAVSSATTVTLTSSSPSATVPDSVVIAAGSQQASFSVAGISEGSATITATLPAAAGGATATASVTVQTGPVCPVPAVPQPAAASTARTGAAYTVSWPAVSGATDYVIEEANNAAFNGAISATTTATSATYSHAAGTFFYRVRARHRAGGCDVESVRSAAISVVVSDVPVAAMRIIPVVGSTRGNAGAFFKTSVQLHNPTAATISGRIVYHPQGVPGAAGDPSLAYAIPARKTLSYDDLLPAMGVDAGVGTADLIADLVGEASSAIPVTSVRIYNDAGAAGTTGLVEEPMLSDDALRAGDVGVLIAPADMQKFRLNVGLRTLDEGADVTITVRDAEGVTVATVTRPYASVYFLQAGSAQFLGGYVLKGGETISVAVTRGRAIVYGAVTDNVTNDPSQQFARKSN